MGSWKGGYCATKMKWKEPPLNDMIITDCKTNLFISKGNMSILLY